MTKPRTLSRFARMAVGTSVASLCVRAILCREYREGRDVSMHFRRKISEINRRLGNGTRNTIAADTSHRAVLCRTIRELAKGGAQ